MRVGKSDYVIDCCCCCCCCCTHGGVVSEVKALDLFLRVRSAASRDASENSDWLKLHLATGINECRQRSFQIVRCVSNVFGFWFGFFFGVNFNITYHSVPLKCSYFSLHMCRNPSGPVGGAVLSRAPAVGCFSSLLFFRMQKHVDEKTFVCISYAQDIWS